MGIGSRYQIVADEVAKHCLAVGRSAEEVRLIAVSKTVGVEGARKAYEAGARDFGENRPDQIVPKAGDIPEANWHFIGNIQSRRIPEIVASASLIHSLFQLSHAEKISAAALKLDKVQDVLVEVNVSGEGSKSGLAPEEAASFIEACQPLEGIRVRGLMTMAPQGDSLAARTSFANLRDLADSIRLRMGEDQARCFTELSMGMSEDWREAIDEGATMVRIGRAIFSGDFE